MDVLQKLHEKIELFKSAGCAKSRAQQRLFGMVHAVQEGEMKPPSKEVAELAKEVKKTDAEEIASTKHKGLPERKQKKKKKKSTIEYLKQYSYQVRQNILNLLT